MATINYEDLVDAEIEMDKKDLVDAVIEMIKQDTAVGNLEDVDRITTCAIKEKLKLYTPDYKEEDWMGYPLIYKCKVCLRSHNNEFSLTCEKCDFKRESVMKTIKLYTVEWRDGYKKHTERDVSLDTIRSWFEDGGGGSADEYADEFKIISDLAVGDDKGFDFTHGMGEMMRITKTTDLEQGYCQIEDGAVYECYFPKNRTFWNGWACPAGLTAKSLCDFLAVSLEGRSSEMDIELCTELLTSIVPQVYGDLTIYGIGDGLIWDECTADGNGEGI